MRSLIFAASFNPQSEIRNPQSAISQTPLPHLSPLATGSERMVRRHIMFEQREQGADRFAGPAEVQRAPQMRVQLVGSLERRDGGERAQLSPLCIDSLAG